MGLLLPLLPAALLLAHGIAASLPEPTSFFALETTRALGWHWRWLLLGSGIAVCLIPALRRWIWGALQTMGKEWNRWPRWIRVGCLFFGVGGLLVGIRCQNFYLGDSYHLVHAIPRGLWVSWNEPLDIMLHAGLHRVLVWFTPLATAEGAYAILSIGAGLVYMGLPGRIARVAGLTGNARSLFIGAMLSMGAMQLFFGYAESYTLCSLVIVLYMASGMRRLCEGTNIALAAFLAGLAVSLHPLSLTLGPSLLYLAWVETGQERKIAHAGGPGALDRWRRLGSAGFWFGLPILLLIVGVVLGGYGLARFGKTDNPGGADKQMLVPLWETSSRFERYTLLSREHVSDKLSALTAGSALGLPMVLLGLLAAWRRRQKLDRGALFLGILAAGMLIFVALWNPDLGAARDWDLFAPAAFPVTALGAYLLATNLQGRQLRDAALLYPMAAAMVAIPWIWSNSTRAMPPRGWRG